MHKILILTMVIAAVLPVRAQEAVMSAERLDTLLNISGDCPIDFSVKVPDGNYRVTVTLGSRKRAAQTVVRAESRRHYTDLISTRRGQFKTVTFTVNKHEPVINDSTTVRLKPRELSYKNWDDALSLHFCGPAPAVQRITIEPDSQAVTLFLCGNSTVVDQEQEPWASWGQMIPRWFDERVVIANYAESGLSATTFLSQLRLDKVLSQLRPGDYVICEFGHNDEKERRAGDGAWYSYSRNLKILADRIRERGGHVILVTPTARRFFNDDQQTLRNTHGDYPEAMRTVARREGIPLIELNGMTHTFFEALGFEGSKRALVHYPADTFPDQPQPLADNTHFNPFGACQVAKMIIVGLQQMTSPLVQYLRPDWPGFDPAHPDSPDAFVWYPSGSTLLSKPDGN